MTSPSRYRLPPTHLDDFVGSYFELAPVVVPQTAPLISPDEAFAALVAASSAANRSGSRLKVFVDGMQVADSHHSVLPGTGDTTLARYQARLAADLSLGEFAIVIGSVQAVSPAIYDRACALLSVLFGNDWLPPGWLDLELFFGRYRSTPGGIHQEPRSNLHCVIAGEKSMLVWPADTWGPEGPPSPGGMPTPEGTSNGMIPDLPAGAMVLPGAAGDMLYWPPQFWHVGTSPDISISVNIAVFQQDDPFELLTRAVGSQLHALSEEPQLPLSSAGGLQGEWRSPRMVERQLQILRQVASSQSLVIDITVEWLKRVSGWAFRTVPHRGEPAGLPMYGLLARPRAVRLCWTTEGDSLIYSANGHAGSAALIPGLVSILERVNTGQPFSPLELFSLSSDSAFAVQARWLLGELYAMRAVAAV